MIKLINEPTVKIIPPNLPPCLKQTLEEKINRITFIASAPEAYESEQDNKSEREKLSGKNSTSEEIGKLTKLNKWLPKLLSNDMIKVWNKLYELKNDSLERLFFFILNTAVQCSNLKQSRTKYKGYEELPVAIEHGKNFYEYLRKYPEVLLNDFTFEGKDKKLHKTLNANYCMLKLLLKSTLAQLRDTEEAKNSPLSKLFGYIEHPESRKHHMASSGAILFSKKLYVQFLKQFHKPLYSIIVGITNSLFETCYTEDEIIKFAIPVRRAIKKTKEGSAQ